MDRKPFEVYEDGGVWKAQLIKYTGNFATKEMAERYVAFVKKNREQNGMKT